MNSPELSQTIHCTELKWAVVNVILHVYVYLGLNVLNPLTYPPPNNNNVSRRLITDVSVHEAVNNNMLTIQGRVGQIWDGTRFEPTSQMQALGAPSGGLSRISCLDKYKFIPLGKLMMTADYSSLGTK